MARHLFLSLLLTFFFSSLGSAQSCEPPIPNPDYCTSEPFKHDPLLEIFNDPKINPYAQYVCTTALQPIVVRPGTTATSTVGGATSTVKSTVVQQTTTTEKDVKLTTVTGDDKTETVSNAIMTVTEYGYQTITEVINHGSTSTISGSTVTRTVATSTRTRPVVTTTVFVTSVKNVGSTSTQTITSGIVTQINTICTSTQTIFTKTNVNNVGQTNTRLNTLVTGTSTVRFITGTETIPLVRGTKEVRVTRTDVVGIAISTRTSVRHTSTFVARPIFSTKTIQSTTSTQTIQQVSKTETALTTVATELVTVGTKIQTIVKVSTISSNPVVFATLTTITGTTTDTTTTIAYSTDFSFPDEDYYPQGPFKRNAKRNQCHAGVPRPTLAEKKFKKDDWIAEYGEDHFKSACSCILHFPLPTSTKYYPPNTTVKITVTPTAAITQTVTSTDVETTRVPTTSTIEVGGVTKTITVPFITTKTIRETKTKRITVGSTTIAFTTKTITRDVTATVTKGLSTQSSTSTRTITNTSNQVVTTRIGASTTIKTEQGVCTKKTQLDLVRTSSVFVDRTSKIGVTLSEGVAVTTTSFYDITKTISVDVTSTLSTIADATVGGVLTITSPAVTTVVDPKVATVTIWTDETTTLGVTATQSVDVTSTATLVTITNLGWNMTTTSVKTVPIEATASATATVTEICKLPVRNGGFELAENDAWFLGWDDTVGGYITTPDRYNGNQGHKFLSNNLYRDINEPSENDYNRYLEVYQDLETCPETWFSCTYSLMFSDEYVTENGWVPYIFAIINDKIKSRRYPDSDNGYYPGRWYTSQFYYLSSTDGKDTWTFESSSPQPQFSTNTTIGGDQFISLDNVYCEPSIPTKSDLDWEIRNSLQDNEIAYYNSIDY